MVEMNSSDGHALNGIVHDSNGSVRNALRSLEDSRPRLNSFQELKEAVDTASSEVSARSSRHLGMTILGFGLGLLALRMLSRR